jgi:hypothetical protein
VSVLAAAASFVLSVATRRSPAVAVILAIVTILSIVVLFFVFSMGALIWCGLTHEGACIS